MKLNILNNYHENKLERRTITEQETNEKPKWIITIKTDDKYRTIITLLCSFNKCYVDINKSQEDISVIAYVEVENEMLLDKKIDELMDQDFIKNINKIPIIGLNEIDKIKKF